MNTRIGRLPLITAGCLLVIGCSAQKTPDASEGQTKSATRQVYTGSLPPLPPPEYQVPRPIEMVQAVYEFAGRRPDVLQYVPCFCGCQASGHVGNDDCFVSSRDGSGKPTWDLHGMG